MIPFRNNALNGTKPISAPVYREYIKQLLKNNPSIQKSINEQLSDTSKETNINKLQQNAEDASKKVIELKEQLAKAEENAKQLSDRVSQLKSSNNSTELPIQYIKTFNYDSILSIKLFKTSPLVKELVDNTFIINDIDTFDENWIKECNKYVDTLSISDKATLLGYTHNGDEYINTYLRYSNIKVELLKNDLQIIFNNLTIQGFPLYAQIFKMNNIDNVESYFNTSKDSKGVIGSITKEGLIKIREILTKSNINNDTDNDTLQQYFTPVIKQFGIDLNNIIKLAPKLTKNIKVYRGVGSDRITQKEIITGFTSTSIALKNVIKFSKQTSNTNKYRIYEYIITVNTPCIFIPPKYTWPAHHGKPEFEVLIGSNIIAIPSDIIHKAFFNPEPENTLISFKEYKVNTTTEGGYFTTRTITVSPASTSGGKRKTYKNNKNKKNYKSKKYTKKHRY